MPKMKSAIVLLGAVLLVSCGTLPANSSSSEAPSQSSSQEEASSSAGEQPSSSEESSSSGEPAKIQKNLIIDKSIAPASVKGGYPADGSFAIGSVGFGYDQIMQGGGDYAGTIQMGKATGRIYNTSPCQAIEIVVTQMNKISEYNFYNATYNLRFGGSIDSLASVDAGITVIAADKSTTTYTLSAPAPYFSLNNDNEENQRAGYIYSINVAYLVEAQ